MRNDPVLREATCRNCASDFTFMAAGGKPRPLCGTCEATHKWCSTCGYALPRIGFGKDVRVRDGLEGCCKQCKTRQFRKRYQRGYRQDPRAARASKILSRYGMSTSDWDAILISQGGRCAICDLDTPNLNIDHCHETGKVRGLLCHPCNKGLGLFRDDADKMLSAVAYLMTSVSLVKVDG